MKLEDAIKQTTFNDEYHKAVVNLIYTYGWVSDRLNTALDSHDLSMQQFNVLRILKGNHPKPCTNVLLRERMLDKNSDITRIVDRLLKKGLVKREQCVDNRRAVDITITQQGLDLLQRIDIVHLSKSALLAELDEVDVQQLNALLDKIRG